ncbi:uncharacterized protein LOC123868946 isoform X2 [Maniola jurtina]|uniref:uncharacterized protein LOC123868946 isoform X2 n=1 Tax=Maniola jurtina TaxID=191418 RepID=UPI001E68A192|nr:uncharacterized protein LOC123868946 isoform X2 [Maniola jurtina]
MASDEQFSLCWNNFHANMSAGFHGLLSRGDLVDVTLAAEGRLLQAHKLVLSVCSPYFQEMFKMNPTHHPIVFLKDVSHSALRDLLQFMYQGEVNVKQEELASFISTAEQLQVKGLTGNQNEESSTPSKPKPTSRPGPRSSQQRQSVMTKLETDLDSKPSSTPVAIKRPNRPSIASNNSSSSQSGPVKRKCVDPLEAGPSGSAKEEFVTIPDEDENNAVAPKMEPEFVNESMWDEDDDGTNNDETNFGEDDSNMEMSGFDGSTTGDGNITGGGEGGAVGDAQEIAPRRNYTKEQMAKAIEEVNRGEKVAVAALKHGVPRITLFNKITGKTPIECNFGPATILSQEEEKLLVQWVLHMADRHFPVTKDHLLDSVQKIIIEKNLDTCPFTNNRPGKKWYASFLKRHPEIKERIAQNLSRARENVTEEELRNWFDINRKYLESRGLVEALTDPNRVFNTDESAFFLQPKAGRVLVRKGYKNVNNVGGGKKANLTVLITANAAGILAPPMVIYPYERIPTRIANSVNKDWGIGKSDSGWMCNKTFCEYVANIFNPWLQKMNIPKPIIFFLDGRRSHLTLHLAELCKSIGIEIIAFHPNSTHLLQPMDVAIFRPLKVFWKEEVSKWKTENPGSKFKEEYFAPVLEAALENINKEMIKNGFRESGIHPFSIEYVDLAKICSSHRTFVNCDSESDN